MFFKKVNSAYANIEQSIYWIKYDKQASSTGGCSQKNILKPGPKPAWHTRVGEEFSERSPNFLNYVLHIFQGGAKEILEVLWSPQVTSLLEA